MALAQGISAQDTLASLFLCMALTSPASVFVLMFRFHASAKPRMGGRGYRVIERATGRVRVSLCCMQTPGVGVFGQGCTGLVLCM
jgi:hypothetical protein